MIDRLKRTGITRGDFGCLIIVLVLLAIVFAVALIALYLTAMGPSI